MTGTTRDTSAVDEIFPALIDSTMVKTFRSCPQKFYREFVCGLSTPEPSTHLHAGAAFATGLEVARREFYSGRMDAELALITGVKALVKHYGWHRPSDRGSASNKTLDRMIGALEYYFYVWPMDQDKLTPVMLDAGPAVEFTFALPIPDCRHPYTGEPLLYGGRFDMLAEMMGNKWIEDDKTTTSLGPAWSKQWGMRSQFTGYAWGAREYGHDIQGAIVRGISILKTKYDHTQAIVYRPQFMIDRWLYQLRLDVDRMIECARRNYYDFNLDDTCGAFGGCMYEPLCSVEEPDNWITSYGVRRWNPTAKDPTDPENDLAEAL